MGNDPESPDVHAEESLMWVRRTGAFVLLCAMTAGVHAQTLLRVISNPWRCAAQTGRFQPPSNLLRLGTRTLLPEHPRAGIWRRAFVERL